MRDRARGRGRAQGRHTAQKQTWSVTVNSECVLNRSASSLCATLNRTFLKICSSELLLHPEEGKVQFFHQWLIVLSVLLRCPCYAFIAHCIVVYQSVFFDTTARSPQSLTFLYQTQRVFKYPWVYLVTVQRWTSSVVTILGQKWLYFISLRHT